MVGEAKPFEGETNRGAEKSQGSKVKNSWAENSTITSAKVTTQDRWKTVKFRRDTHGEKIQHGWNNRKSKDCTIESTATYSPKTSNRFEVLGGITTIDDEDAGEEESYAGPNKIEYPREKRVPRESTYADAVSSRDVKEAKFRDPVHIKESKNKDWQSGSQERQNFQQRQGNYSSQQQHKQTVYVLGDSMIRNVRRQNVNRESRMHYTHLKTFSGARVEEMKHYMETAIASEPEGIIIHSGTNNLRNEDPNSVANKII